MTVTTWRPPVAGVVSAIEPRSGETILVVEGGGRGTATVAVPWLPDGDAARRWRTCVRWIDRVVLRVGRDGAQAEVHGVGHRLPLVRRISVPVALGLWRDGVQLIVLETD